MFFTDIATAVSKRIFDILNMLINNDIRTNIIKIINILLPGQRTFPFDPMSQIKPPTIKG